MPLLELSLNPTSTPRHIHHVCLAFSLVQDPLLCPRILTLVNHFSAVVPKGLLNKGKLSTIKVQLKSELICFCMLMNIEILFDFINCSAAEALFLEHGELDFVWIKKSHII